MQEEKDLRNSITRSIESELLQPRYVKNYKLSFYVATSLQNKLFLDIASGTSVDWAFNEFNIPLAYTFEFIGLGYGFVLPPEHILRNCYETRDAIIAMVAKSRELGYMNFKP